MLSAATLVRANWIPDTSGGFQTSPTPYVILLIAGFVIGTFGHLIKSRTVTAIGVGFIFLACLILPLAANLANT